MLRLLSLIDAKLQNLALSRKLASIQFILAPRAATPGAFYFRSIHRPEVAMAFLEMFTPTQLSC